MRYTSSLGSCQSSIYNTKMEESRLVPFPTAQVNLPACSTHCFFDTERQAGELRIPIIKSMVWPDSESNPSLQLLRWILLPLGHLSCYQIKTRSRFLALNKYERYIAKIFWFFKGRSAKKSLFQTGQLCEKCSRPPTYSIDSAVQSKKDTPVWV